MRVLAVDTTSPRGSLAIADETGILAEERVESTAGHSRWLLPAVQRALQELDLAAAAIDLFAVTSGPGSFTGLRVGISTVQGLSLAARKPCLGIPTLDVWARQARGTAPSITVVLDAFRGEVWAKALGYLKETETAASRSSLDAALIGSEAGALWWNGEYARAIEVGRRDLAVAAAFKNFNLNIVTNLRLGQVHHALANYPQAANLFRRTMESLQGDLQRQHFGMAGLPSVYARAWLAWCLAELGDFQEGIVQGEEGVAIAESADDAHSRVLAAWGLGTLHVVRGDVDRAITVLERGLVVTRMADRAILFPFVASPLGRAALNMLS